MNAGAWLHRAGLAGLIVGAVGISGPAHAQQTPVVVELFTSQGCVACPPADAYFAELAAQTDLIALALHVDYWDYLGWKDSFGSAAFTQRQKRYAKAAGARMIYTPQVIVGGLDRVEGTRPQEIRDSIAAHAAMAPRVTLGVRWQGERLTIEAEADPPLGKPAVVHLVRYDPEETVLIERGENAGQTITYHNIVTDWSAIGEWSGKAALMLSADAMGPEPLVVIVQEAGPGPILAAVRLER